MVLAERDKGRGGSHSIFAPKRYVEDGAKRGIFTPLSPEDMQRALDEHATAIQPDEVACYCFACDMGLEAGGVNAHNLIELISGKFLEE